MQTVEKAPDTEEVFLEQEGEIGIAALVNLSKLDISTINLYIGNFPSDL